MNNFTHNYIYLGCCIILFQFNIKADITVSQHGISWQFEGDNTYGQFVNGDYWVLGPVVLTAVTPFDFDQSDSSDFHGTMLNPEPEGEQGWGSRSPDYNRNLNIARALPYTVATNQSIVSSITSDTGEYDRWIDTIAVVTIVDSIPVNGTFRPPFYGSSKPLHWNKSALNYELLPALQPTPSTPPLSSTMSLISGMPWIEGNRYWSGKFLMPHKNHKDYGREIAHYLGEALLQLQLNYSNDQKEPLLIDIIQRGIDIYGYYDNGGITLPDGGHKHGRKAAMLFASIFLDDPDLTRIASSNNTFQEDQTTFIISQHDVDRAVRAGSTYSQSDVGIAEWGIRHITHPEQDNSDWTAPYRTVVGPSLVSHALAFHIMNKKDTWNWDPFFDYIDRLYSIESDNSITGYSNYVTNFSKEMWEAYRYSNSINNMPTAPSELTTSNSSAQ